MQLPDARWWLGGRSLPYRGSPRMARTLYLIRVIALRPAVEQEIRERIQEKGRITFAEFMQVCLYSPKGGFYSTRANRISVHFGTSPASHPAFGALIARQLEQMWRLLGTPTVFHVIEVGSGDGQLARSILNASRQTAPQFARALQYVASDYEPGWLQFPGNSFDGAGDPEDATPVSGGYTGVGVEKVKTEGLRPFRNLVGCILCNELIDNFAFHRFAIQAGRVKEVFVTLAGGNLAEALDEPSTPRIDERLTSLGLSLDEGYRGEVCLALDDWASQLATVLDRGFVLTIDYGELAADLYSSGNAGGTLVCYKQHVAGADPYRHVGEQDITCQVDFTSLMRLGEQHGLSTVGYALQSRFLENLGFSSFLGDLQSKGLSAARTEFNRTALMTLVDPGEYGDFKVLAQARGVGPGVELLGFEGQGR